MRRNHRIYHPDARALAARRPRHPQLRPPPRQRLASPHQPLPGGWRLIDNQASADEQRVSLANPAGHMVRSWRITSQTELGGLGRTPALVHDDLVIMLDIHQQTPTNPDGIPDPAAGPNGAIRVRFAIALPNRVMWGGEHVTGLRVGPDGQLYQLRTDRTTGVSIARYALTAKPALPTTVAPGSGPVPPSTLTLPAATNPPAATVTPPTTPPVVRTTPAARSILPWVAAVAARPWSRP